MTEITGLEQCVAKEGEEGILPKFIGSIEIPYEMELTMDIICDNCGETNVVKASANFQEIKCQECGNTCDGNIGLNTLIRRVYNIEKALKSTTFKTNDK